MLESQLHKEVFAIIDEDSQFFNELDSKIVSLYNEAKKDSEVTRFNIRDKSLLISTYRTKWLMILTKEKQEIKKLIIQKENYIETQISKSANGTAIPKIAIKNNIENSKEVANFELAISKQKELITFLNGVCAIFNDFSFTINNSLNALEQELS